MPRSIQHRLPPRDAQHASICESRAGGRGRQVPGAYLLPYCGAALLALAVAACGGDDHKRPQPASNDSVDTGEIAKVPPPDPNEYGPPPSDPCETEGEKRECGRVYQTDGDYVTCSVGYQTCTNGAWSDCVGDHLVVKKAE